MRPLYAWLAAAALAAAICAGTIVPPEPLEQTAADKADAIAQARQAAHEINYPTR